MRKIWLTLLMWPLIALPISDGVSDEFEQVARPTSAYGSFCIFVPAGIFNSN